MDITDKMANVLLFLCIEKYEEYKEYEKRQEYELACESLKISETEEDETEEDETEEDETEEDETEDDDILVNLYPM